MLMLKNPLRSASRAWTRHRIRHTSVGCGCLFADRIDYINTDHWDRLVQSQSLCMSRRYLKVLEQHGPSNIVGRYAIVYRGDEPVAAISAQRVTLSARQLENSSAPSRRNVVKRAVAPFKGVTQQMFVCGNLLSSGNHGIALAPNADDSIIGAVAEAIYRMRRADKIIGNTDLVMIKDITADLEPTARQLRTYSYRRMETEPNMVLTIKPDWRSFEDYLGALNASYRKNARSIFKQIDAAGISLAPLNPTSENAASLHGLYMQVHAGAAIRLFTLADSFLPAIAAALGKSFVCIAATMGDQIVGFITVLKDGDTAIGYFVGFDRAVNADHPLYFRLLFAAIESAIALGCTRLSFGRTALEPKARLGAKPEPMAVYVRHRIPMLNLIVKAAANHVHHDMAPDRNPFKS